MTVDEARARLDAHGVPAAVSVHPSAVPDDVQVRARALLTTVRHPVAGAFVQVGIPLQLSVDAPAVKGPAPAPARWQRAARTRRAHEARHRPRRRPRDDQPTAPRAAEAAGLDGIWAAETVNDPFLSLAIAAEHSERITLGTAVAIAFARNPMSLAYTANQLQEYSRGRSMLGLGSQVRAHIERRFSAAVVATRGADARVRACAARDLGVVERRHATRLHRRLLHAHPDDARVRAAAPRVRCTSRVPRRGRTADDRGSRARSPTA